MQTISASDLPAPLGGYSAAVLVDVPRDGHLLFVSGQTPEGADGTVQGDPERQLRQVWANVRAVVREAGADLSALVHIRTYLAHRDFRDVNSRVRQQVLGAHTPALTVVICDLYEPEWVAEIEAVAVLPLGEA